MIVGLKEKWSKEYEQWNRRDLSDKEYVYIWADGIHTNVRLEGLERKRQCMLVLMGAAPDGKKELVAVVDGRPRMFIDRMIVRENSWRPCGICAHQKQDYRRIRNEAASGSLGVGVRAANDLPSEIASKAA
jgi:hypothetical protein